MDEEQIIALFKQKINEKGIGAEVGFSKTLLYDYRHRKKLTTGDMLDFLFKVSAIHITLNDSPYESTLNTTNES